MCLRKMSVVRFTQRLLGYFFFGFEVINWPRGKITPYKEEILSSTKRKKL